jgi:hypothetical protein
MEGVVSMKGCLVVVMIVFALMTSAMFMMMSDVIMSNNQIELQHTYYVQQNDTVWDAVQAHRACAEDASIEDLVDRVRIQNRIDDPGALPVGKVIAVP